MPTWLRSMLHRSVDLPVVAGAAARQGRRRALSTSSVGHDVRAVRIAHAARGVSELATRPRDVRRFERWRDGVPDPPRGTHRAAAKLMRTAPSGITGTDEALHARFM